MTEAIQAIEEKNDGGYTSGRIRGFWEAVVAGHKDKVSGRVEEALVDLEQTPVSDESQDDFKK